MSAGDHYPWYLGGDGGVLSTEWVPWYIWLRFRLTLSILRALSPSQTNRALMSFLDTTTCQGIYRLAFTFVNVRSKGTHRAALSVLLVLLLLFFSESHSPDASVPLARGPSYRSDETYSDRWSVSLNAKWSLVYLTCKLETFLSLFFLERSLIFMNLFFFHRIDYASPLSFLLTLWNLTEFQFQISNRSKND